MKFGVASTDDKAILRSSHDWREMLSLGLKEESLNEFKNIVYELVNKKLPDAPFHRDAFEVLQKLKEKSKRIAIFSTMDRSIFEPAIKYRNLHEVVEVAIAGTDVPYRKPHPAGILKALDDLKIPKKEFKTVVYMGDKDTDIQAAQNAGIDSILYYPIEHELMYSLEELKKHEPCYIISDWRELLEN